jgi:para-aminobenzoate synthetase/4-amino-4-deoxychorismate lyase
VTRARFDDLAPGSERSFRLTGPVAELVAATADEVLPILGRAEAEAAGGRWVAGFVTYEAAPALDPACAVRAVEAGSAWAELPLAWFGVFEGREPVPPPEPSSDPGPADAAGWRPSIPRDRYLDAVERIRELIAAGEAYQVNHTLRMRTELGAGATADGGLDRRYAELVLAQRGGFGADLRAGRFRILSASPELFFSWDGDRVTTRPMKGTARRGRWPEEDAAAAAALRASAKDRAENAMIVDLLRNDLGRVAVPGTVVADPLFSLERYETVWQMTSTVSGRVPSGTTLPDVFRALFPSGSVTGAPKIASMRVIAELEDSPRGVYTGAVGYLAPPGSGEPRAEFSVAIRTIQVDTATGAAEYGVGGGITFDSSAEAEHEEVRAKSAVLTELRPRFDLFETVRYEPGRGFLHLREHLGRLGRSAAYFGFRLDPKRVREQLEEAAAGASEPLRARLALGRDGSTRLQVASAPALGAPVRVAIVEDPPVDPEEVWLFHKTTMRETYERRRRLRPEADDVLLVNTAGLVTESTIANLAARVDGSWLTPPVADGLLPGTYRDVLVREGRLLERSLRMADVRRAQALALVSSVRGWRPAELLG